MAIMNSLRYFKFNQLLLIRSRFIINHGVRIISLKACPSEFKRTYPEVGHEERNEKLGRPQSPHLSIYKAQLTSTLSIMHRTSGIVLCSYIWAFGIGCLIYDFDKIYDKLIELNLHPALIILGKLAIACPMVYHFVNGIRHLVWDMGKFLTIKQVYRTGYVTILVTIAAIAYLLVYT